jgi:hypothetical protein
VVVFVWFVVIASIGISEAHAMSGWRGVATLLVSALVPLIVLIAVVLTALTLK